MAWKAIGVAPGPFGFWQWEISLVLQHSQLVGSSAARSFAHAIDRWHGEAVVVAAVGLAQT